MQSDCRRGTDVHALGDRPASDVIIELCVQIAKCAAANRAALQLSFYEIPTSSQ